MKKIQISIPTPCHEDWNAMTPETKGRFCASCQKTVIDFSTMSDRQLAEFFKKPAGSLCGRFHTDQLNRQIQVPKKRIPWVKYFFTVTWPAFVLLLKSCGPKNEIMGLSLVENSRMLQGKQMVELQGEMEIQSVGIDTLPNKEPKETICTVEPPPTTVGIISPTPHEEVMGDTIITPLPVTNEITPKEYTPMDTVAISSAGSFSAGRMIAGGISVMVSKKEISTEKNTRVAPEEKKMTVFPNPVRSGAQVTIDYDFINDTPKQIQLFSTGGNLITVKQFNWTKGGKPSFVTPLSLPAGTYFIRLLTEKAHTQTSKIVIIN
jgi:hypothetical protein